MHFCHFILDYLLRCGVQKQTGQWPRCSTNTD